MRAVIRPEIDYLVLCVSEAWHRARACRRLRKMELLRSARCAPALSASALSLRSSCIVSTLPGETVICTNARCQDEGLCCSALERAGTLRLRWMPHMPPGFDCLSWIQPGQAIDALVVHSGATLLLNERCHISQACFSQQTLGRKMWSHVAARKFVIPALMSSLVSPGASALMTISLSVSTTSLRNGTNCASGS